jgi:alpha-tubulin suppressor-like RCC1 family protein
MSNLLLIDEFVNDKQFIIDSLDNNTKYIVLNSTNDSLEDILNKIRNLESGSYYSNIALLKINDGSLFAKSVYHSEESETYSSDLQSLKNFFTTLINEFNTINFDIISCNSYNEKWVNFLNKITNDININVRASVDVTGGINGNWILESHNVNLVGLYFYENINNYQYSLDITSTMTYLDQSKNLWLWGNGNNGQIGRKTLYGSLLLNFNRSIIPNNYKPIQISLGTASTAVLVSDASNVNKVLTSSVYPTSTMKNWGTHIFREVIFPVGLVPELISHDIMSVVWVSMTNGQLWSFGQADNVLLGVSSITNQQLNVASPQQVDTTMVPAGLKAVKICSVVGVHTSTYYQINPAGNIVLFKDSNGQNGKVYGSGYNTTGFLGLGHTNQVNLLTEIPMPSGKTPKDIFTGFNNLFVIMTDNTLYSCGWNGDTGNISNHIRLIGQPRGVSSVSSLTQVTIPNLPVTSYPVSVCSAEQHTAVLMNNGAIYSIGNQNFGIMGRGDDLSGNGIWQEMLIPSGKIPDKISATKATTFVRMTDGNLWYTGSSTTAAVNLDGSLSKILLQIPLPIGVKARNFYTSPGYTMAVMADNIFNTMYITGYAESKDLGSTTSLGYAGSWNPSPIRVPLISQNSSIKQVETGDLHTMILMDDASGTLYCMGSGPHGQLGKGTITGPIYDPSIVPLPSGKKPVKISCGANHTLVLMSDGTVYGCGQNNNGQLGIQNLISSTVLTPMVIDSITALGGKAVDIFTTTISSVIITDASEVWSCGLSNGGMFGLGNTTDTVYSSLQKMNLPQGMNKFAKTLAASNTATMVCFTDNTLYACGRSGNAGASFNFGNAQWDTCGNLVDVCMSMIPNGSVIKQIKAGDWHFMVLLDDASGSCYVSGPNSNGVLGLGNTSYTRYLTKVTNIPQGKKIVSIDSGTYNSVIKFEDEDRPYVAGDNTNGQLGEGIKFSDTSANSSTFKKTVIKDINYLLEVEQAPPQELYSYLDVTVEELVNAGYSIQSVSEIDGFSVAWLPQGNNAVLQGLIDAGYTIQNLIDSSYSISELKNYFTKEEFEAAGISYYYYYFGQNVPLSPICFLAGTPVKTDQGVVKIEQLDPNVHTITGDKIVAITQTKSTQNNLIRIKKNALGVNVPKNDTIITKNHKVLYKNKLVESHKLIGLEGVEYVKYNGEMLYNILMNDYRIISINNMFVETLDPKNIVAKIFSGKYSKDEQIKITKQLNDIIMSNDTKKYKDLCKKF